MELRKFLPMATAVMFFASETKASKRQPVEFVIIVLSMWDFFLILLTIPVIALTAKKQEYPWSVTQISTIVGIL